MINEARSHLGEKLGDILASLQNLSDDAPNLGTKKLVSSCEGVVKNIRPILRGDWPDTEKPTLRTLQKVAVALKKTIDSDEDLKSTVATAVQELQKTSEKLGEPVNQIGSEDATEATPQPPKEPETPTPEPK